MKVLNANIKTNTCGEYGLKITAQNENVLNAVIEYACYSPEFLTRNANYSFRKGLLIIGNYGSGKTEIMKAYKVVMDKMNVGCGLLTTTDITAKYNEYNENTKRIMGSDGIKAYLNPNDNKERIFDDLGSEAFLSDYGNKKSAMIEILETRYKYRQNGLKTHLTTNLSLDGLKEKYGERMYSRFKEIFNVVILGNGNESIDFRK